MKKFYVVHCKGDDDLKTTLCKPDERRPRYSSYWHGDRHIVVSAARVANSANLEVFEGGRTFQSQDNPDLSMRFCQDCVDHPDLGLMLLRET